MGRLDNIIARNKRPHSSERTIVSLVFGSIILVILGLAVFTDLGAPPEEPAPPPAAVAPASPTSHDRRLDGVMLGRQRAVKPAPVSTAPSPPVRTSP